MPAKLDKPAAKLLVRIDAEDVATLDSFHQAIPRSRVIRHIVRSYCQRLRTAAAYNMLKANNQPQSGDSHELISGIDVEES